MGPKITYREGKRKGACNRNGRADPVKRFTAVCLEDALVTEESSPSSVASGVPTLSVPPASLGHTALFLPITASPPGPRPLSTNALQMLTYAGNHQTKPQPPAPTTQSHMQILNKSLSSHKSQGSGGSGQHSTEPCPAHARDSTVRVR